MKRSHSFLSGALAGAALDLTVYKQPYFSSEFNGCAGDSQLRLARSEATLGVVLSSVSLLQRLGRVADDRGSVPARVYQGAGWPRAQAILTRSRLPKALVCLARRTEAQIGEPSEL